MGCLEHTDLFSQVRVERWFSKDMVSFIDFSFG
jgi:hypothetical protein